MTFPVSTVPAVIANLLTGITAACAGDALASEILIVQGEEGSDSPPDIINVAIEVRRQVEPLEIMGSYQQGALYEDYEIDVRCSSWTGGADPTVITARVWQLVGYVETAVRTDPSLGTNVIEAHPSSATGGNATWTDDPAGRMCEVVVAIKCRTLN